MLDHTRRVTVIVGSRAASVRIDSCRHYDDVERKKKCRSNRRAKKACSWFTKSATGVNSEQHSFDTRSDQRKQRASLAQNSCANRLHRRSGELVAI